MGGKLIEQPGQPVWAWFRAGKKRKIAKIAADNRCMVTGF
jgi:hypothetical protein